MESKPFYQSTAFIVLASILFPPAGLVLLWARPGTDTIKKIGGSIALLVLGAGYVAALSAAGVLPSIFVKNPELEAHYTELEEHRAKQRQAAAEAPAAEPAAAPPAEQPAAAPSNAGAAPAPAPSSFRRPSAQWARWASRWAIR